MKVSRRGKASNHAHVDRHVSDFDVLEHVISGVRLSLMFQTLRDAKAVARDSDNPGPLSFSVDDDQHSP